MSVAANILAANILVSLASLIGVLFVSVREQALGRLSRLLVAFASGSLVGGAFFHLIPESLEQAHEATFVRVVAGILAFLALEKFLCWRHCHEGKCEVHSFVYLNLIGDGVHNFLDGMIIAGGFLVSTELGLVTTAVILFHEVPQELGDFGVLIYGGFSKARALLFNLLSALTAVLGGAFAYFFSLHVQDLSAWLLPFAAGGFIYIALVDLIPELHNQKRPNEAWWQFGLICLGLAILWLAALWHHE